MGSVFSKKLTIKDKLLNIENEVIKSEYELGILKRANYYSVIVITILCVPLVSYFSFILEISIVIALGLLIFTMSSVFYLLRTLKRKRVDYKEKRLALLKQDRKNLIEQCKSDVNFSMTKSLIEKYEEEESRSTFFNQLKKKNKNKMDLFTDFVLGNDPATLNALICKNCGAHNGLIDPKNDDFSYFQCYNCSFKNERKVNKI